MPGSGGRGYPPFEIVADLLSAMAYQQLGETQKARLTLDLALRRIDSDLPPISDARPMQGSLYPSDWLICQTLRREAESLIAGKKGVDLATAKNKPDDVRKWQAELAKYRVKKPDDQKVIPSTESSVPSKVTPKK